MVDIQTVFNVLVTICVIVIVVFLFVLSDSITGNQQYQVYSPPPECTHEDLHSSVNCMTDFVSGFYFYNKTKDSVHKNFTELVKGGEDCRGWSEYYVSTTRALGFNASAITFYLNDTSAHSFAIVWDNTGYCTIDGLNSWCIEFVA